MTTGVKSAAPTARGPLCSEPVAPVGRAWQSCLVAGLIEREIDLGDASLIIGTSAGAIVGAQLALGLKFAAPSKLDPAVHAAPASASSHLSGLLAAIARAVRSSEPEIERAKIGAFAIEAPTASEEESIARTAFGPCDSARLR